MSSPSPELSPELSVVLPSYREAESLRTLLPSLIGSVSGLGTPFEILVVDAEQPLDATEEVCAPFAPVRYLRRRGGNCYGDAVRTGIAESRGEFVLFMDADGSHNPAHIPALWRRRHAVDVVVGSRYTEGGATENPAILIFMSWLVNVTFRTCFQLRCKDVTNSFRLYRGSRLRELQLRSDDFDIVEEMLILLCCGRRKGTLEEVPVVFERRKAGETKRDLVKFAFSYLSTLVHLLRVRMAAGA